MDWRINFFLLADSHVIKAVRALLEQAGHSGYREPGHLVGTWQHGNPERETVPGLSKLGGDLYIRAAAMMLKQTVYADTGSKEDGFWDMSGLEWDGAWQ